MGLLEACDVVADPGLAHFDPPVAAVNVNMTVSLGIVEEGADVIGQRPLVALEAKGIICRSLDQI